MRGLFACVVVACGVLAHDLGVLAISAEPEVATYTARRAALACRSSEILARANDVLGSGDGEAWAKFTAIAVFAGDCIVIPAGASVVGALEDFWGDALRIHRQGDATSYLANPDEFISVTGEPEIGGTIGSPGR